MADSARIWDRMSEETDKSYAAFRMYLEMESRERTLLKVSDTLGYKRRKPLPKPVPASTIEQWSSKYRWLERVAAYDLHMNLIADGEREKQQQKHAEKWSKRKNEHRERAWGICKKMLARAEALLEKSEIMLNTPTHTQHETTTDDGKTVIHIMPTDNWTMKDAGSFGRVAAAMVDSADKIIRLAAEMETERVKFEFDLSELPSEYLERIARGEQTDKVVRDFRLVQGGLA